MEQQRTLQIPILSIIIPTFNSGNSVELTLLSIISQKHPEVEIIIIDGASTDNTLEIIDKYQSSIAYIKSESDNGVYDAMNKGIEKAKGNFIYFIGADDIMLPNSLNLIIPNLISSNTIYYGNAFFPKRNLIYDGKFNSYKLALRNICHQAIFYPRIVFDAFYYNQLYSSYSDYELNLKLWKDKRFRFKHIKHTVSIFNDYYGISKSEVDVNFIKDKQKIIYNNLGLLSTIFFILKKKVVTEIKRRFFI